MGTQGGIATLVRSHWELTWELAKLEIKDRYVGYALGTLWAFVQPLLLVGVYLFLFGIVLRPRLSGAQGLDSYAVYLLSGLIPWIATQEALVKSVTAVASNADLVKQVVFPVEVLPVKSALSSLFTLVIPYAGLVAFVCLGTGQVRGMLALLPALVLLHAVLLVGWSFLLASIGVHVRDLRDVVQMGCFLGTFMLPIFFLPEWVPSVLKPVVVLNPFSSLIWCYQDVAYFGRMEHPWAWAALAAFAGVSLFLGSGVFRALKPRFGSVL